VLYLLFVIFKGLIDNKIMAELSEYLDQLEKALLKKHTELEKKEIPQLKENLRSFFSAFSSIHKLLMDKGLLQTDPYKYEQKTDLAPPSSDPFTETESSRELSFRLTTFASTLDYLNNFFHISSDTLELNIIKKILHLVDYIKWTDFSVNSSLVMTRTLAGMLEKVKDLKDDMSILVITSALGQLRDRSKEIKQALKKISLYQRERYKFQVRSLVTSHMTTLSPSTLKEGINEAVLSVKVEFSTQMPNQPFYKELIQELLQEDYGSDKETLQEVALRNLEVKNQVIKKKKHTKQIDAKKELMKIISLIAKCSTQLSASYTKLENNHRASNEIKRSFGEALAYWIKNIFSSPEKTENYELRVVDPMTSLKKKEIVNYAIFTDSLSKKIQVLRSLETNASPVSQKLKSSSTENLFNFIEKSIHELRSYHKKLEGFENHYRSLTDPEIKPKIKSLKVENDTLKYQIGTITRNMNEVSAAIEEEKQLKALGIDG